MTNTTRFLEGRRAIITGAGRGIGAGIAESLAAAGATMVINARTEAYLKPLAERLAATYGLAVHAFASDVTTPDACRALVAEAERCLGGVDILVNALGDAVMKPLVVLPDSDEPATSDTEVDEMIALNLTSAVYAMRAVAPGMIERRWGRIITLSGGYGARRGRENLAIYSAAKAGLGGLSRSLAREWGRFGITVNTIAPGTLPDPDHTSSVVNDYIERVIVPEIPLGRVGHPREIGPLAVFLASDNASYISGAEIVVDGGYFA